MMKNIFTFSLVTASLLSGVNAIEMTDYKVVDSLYQDAYLNGKLNVKSGNQDQTSYDVHLNANAKVVKSTLPYSWDFQIDGNSDFSKGPNSSDKSLDSYDTTAVTHYDQYIHNDDKLFVYGSGNLGYRKGSAADSADDPFVKVGAGAGYGRVYNATALAKALRIVEDLLEYNLIKDDLSDKAYITLAAVVDKEDEYKSKFGLTEYKKYWYEAMEKVLKDSGVLDKDSLGAFGIVRINEILEIERVSNRIHGWKVRGGFGKIISNYDGKSEDTTLDAEFEYGLPIGHESQYTENLTLSKLLDNDTDTEFSLLNTMGYTYEISDRIDWENNWVLSYQQNDVADDFMSNALTTGFRYYLANRLSFDTTFSLTKINKGIGK
jgi:hypothetical protein